ncbi:peptidase S10 [Marinicaulis flavus]|uniref:Peptidase S10 n=1 Tax=Hyphococcus luteus TaxID=2058213 RepID=A0A2S7K8J6_9PROT|nr:peptidase S10 [Marinicaulis flavus]
MIFLYAGCAAAQEEEKKQEEKAENAKEAPPEPRVFENKGRVSVNGKTVSYRVIAGETYLKDDKGEPVASIFSTTYLADGYSDPRQRPVAFIFNGGPGSASLWLHMGMFGPKRVVLPDHGDDGAAPFNVTANTQSILDVADMVFIDPVGTGWSKTLGETKTDDYWGVKQDAASVREFIRRWLIEHKRWNSPKYLIGESYGTTRSGALLDALEGGWNDIAMNGVVLISSVLNFSLDATDNGNDVGYIGIMPSYAAAAWYHEKVDRAKWDGDFDRFLKEARAFATDEYMPALLKGQLLAPEAHDAVVDKLAGFIGLTPSYIDRSNMRVPLFRFMRELLRDKGVTIGRFDARFTGVEPDGVSEFPEDDPSGYGIDGAYTAAMLDYYTRDLGVDITDRYVTLGGVTEWNWDADEGGGDNSYVNVAPWIERAMRQNKDLRVLSANGYYDMATPFFGTEMTLAQPGFDRSRLKIAYYPAGHMMYLHQPSFEKLAADVRAFISGE